MTQNPEALEVEFGCEVQPRSRWILRNMMPNQRMKKQVLMGLLVSDIHVPAVHPTISDGLSAIQFPQFLPPLCRHSIHTGAEKPGLAHT